MPAHKLNLKDAVEGYPKVLLDTCILIPEFNHTRLSVPVLLWVPRHQRCTPVIAIWEFLHGKEGLPVKADMLKARRKWLDDQSISRLPLQREVTQTFESLLVTRMSPPGAVDCMIAAEAKARRFPLVTRNVQDFEDVPGLLLVPIP